MKMGQFFKKEALILKSLKKSLDSQGFTEIPRLFFIFFLKYGMWNTFVVCCVTTQIGEAEKPHYTRSKKLIIPLFM